MHSFFNFVGYSVVTWDVEFLLENLYQLARLDLEAPSASVRVFLYQYFYLCTIKASKLSTILSAIISVANFTTCTPSWACECVEQVCESRRRREKREKYGVRKGRQ